MAWVGAFAGTALQRGIAMNRAAKIRGKTNTPRPRPIKNQRPTVTPTRRGTQKNFAAISPSSPKASLPKKSNIGYCCRMYRGTRKNNVVRTPSQPIKPKDQESTPTPKSLAEFTFPSLVEAAQDRLALKLAAIKIELPTVQTSLPEKLAILEESLSTLHDPIRHSIRELFAEINEIPKELRTMGSFEANKAFCKTLQRILNTIGERLRCHRCDKPGILACKIGGVPTGVFVFVHSSHSRVTNHGGSTRLPLLSFYQKS